MAKKKAKITEEEIVREAEAQGDLSHEEADQILEDDGVLDASPTEEAAETDVKRPVINGHRERPKFEQPGTNNMSRVDIGANPEETE